MDYVAVLVGCVDLYGYVDTSIFYACMVIANRCTVYPNNPIIAADAHYLV